MSEPIASRFDALHQSSQISEPNKLVEKLEESKLTNSPRLVQGVLLNPRIAGVMETIFQLRPELERKVLEAIVACKTKEELTVLFDDTLNDSYFSMVIDWANETSTQLSDVISVAKARLVHIQNEADLLSDEIELPMDVVNSIEASGKDLRSEDIYIDWLLEIFRGGLTTVQEHIAWLRRKTNCDSVAAYHCYIVLSRVEPTAHHRWLIDRILR